jgi:ABC-2 type transport system ATP-binding protein
MQVLTGVLAMDITQILRIQFLTKRYSNGVVANDNLSLNISAGQIYGLLGPNGAGKTTLVKQIVGLLKPTKGIIMFGDTDLVAHPEQARYVCSYLPQGSLPINSIRLRDAIEIVGLIRGGEKKHIRKRTREIIERIKLGQWADRTGGKLSGGVQRLFGFAMATVNPGQIIILDEPTNDVDPLRRRLMWNYLRILADEGRIVLLVTHNINEAEQHIDRLALMNRGKIIAEGTPSSLLSSVKGKLLLMVDLIPERTRPDVPQWAQNVAMNGRKLCVTIKEPDSPEAIDWSRKLTRGDIAESFSLGPITLEDKYYRIFEADNLDDFGREVKHAR